MIFDYLRNAQGFAVVALGGGVVFVVRVLLLPESFSAMATSSLSGEMER